ncbi:MAG: hypothetical protein AMJ55_00310 [Gammaproteobacteria bacterium SG8_15]|nr:MAG: hypothetical protein AMJ55_00310 [Gammaproteobacteria bacterium SG8_15]
MHDGLRAASLAASIGDQVAAWVQKYDIQDLEVCIETPILNVSRPVGPVNYSKQIRLLHAIEMVLFVMPIRNLWITHVAPATSKRLATGDGRAKKDEIIAKSPVSDERFGFTKAQREALADAWAHSLSAGDRQWFFTREYLVVCPPKFGGN